MSKKEKLQKLYYSHIGDGYFIDALNNFCSCQGFGTRGYRCVFAKEYESWEEAYFGENGVAFYFDHPAVEKDEVIFLDEKSFYEYLLEACEDYLTRNPTDEQEAKKLLEEILSNLNIT